MRHEVSYRGLYCLYNSRTHTENNFDRWGNFENAPQILKTDQFPGAYTRQTSSPRPGRVPGLSNSCADLEPEPNTSHCTNGAHPFVPLYFSALPGDRKNQVSKYLVQNCLVSGKFGDVPDVRHRKIS